MYINIILSFFTAMSLYASNIEPVKNFNSYPLAKEATSISRGGTLNDKSANEDGIGTVLIGGIGNETNDINNKTYNQALKNNSSTLSDTTNLKDLTINIDDLNSMNNNKFVKLNNVNGTTCNDNDSQTINDQYQNNICIGTNVEGQSCNDNNDNTLNDKYTNGICIGKLKYKSCKEVLNGGDSIGSGIYTIFNSSGDNSYNVYCDMITDGGGWTRIEFNTSKNKISTSSAPLYSAHISSSSFTSTKISVSGVDTQWGGGIAIPSNINYIYILNNMNESLLKITNGISHLKYNCSPNNRYLYNSYPYNSIRSSMVSAGYNDENYVIFNRNGYYNNCGVKLSTNAIMHEFELYFR